MIKYSVTYISKHPRINMSIFVKVINFYQVLSIFINFYQILISNMWEKIGAVKASIIFLSSSCLEKE